VYNSHAWINNHFWGEIGFYAEDKGKGKNAEGVKSKPSKEGVAAFGVSLSKLGNVYICDRLGTAHMVSTLVSLLFGKQ